jgi:sugar O-acyltransferase (sialic acid O-acetyltransferase NeuD family)
MEIVIWGGTGHARVVREALSYEGHKVIAVFDRRKVEPPFKNVYMGVGWEEFEIWKSQHDPEKIGFVVAIGGDKGKDRLQIYDRLVQEKLQPITIKHPSAFIANDTILSEGVQILGNASVATSVYLGKCVIVNTSASVDHDCIIHEGVHIAPNASLAGEIELGSYSFVGIGAVILPHLKIGTGAFIGAGSVVTRNVPPNSLVIGSPAKIVRKTHDR